MSLPTAQVFQEDQLTTNGISLPAGVKTKKRHKRLISESFRIRSATRKLTKRFPDPVSRGKTPRSLSAHQGERISGMTIFTHSHTFTDWLEIHPPHMPCRESII